MRRIKLKALKKCPGAKPGEEFMANSVEAKALVALGFAKRLGQPAYSQLPPSADVQSPASDSQQPAPAVVLDEPPQPAEPIISKAVLELAQTAGLDVSMITGTGKDGRITRGDIEAAIPPAQAQE